MTKRTFGVLREKILQSLDQQKTVNQLAIDAGINWKTVDNHITHLIGKGLVKPVFVSRYVKIYELTETGKQHVRSAP